MPHCLHCSRWYWSLIIFTVICYPADKTVMHKALPVLSQLIWNSNIKHWSIIHHYLIQLYHPCSWFPCFYHVHFSYIGKQICGYLNNVSWHYLSFSTGEFLFILTGREYGFVKRVMEMHHAEDVGIRVVISDKDLQDPYPEHPKP